MAFKIGDFLPNTPHLFADLAELLTLLNLTGQFDLHKNQLAAIKNQEITSADELDFEDIENAVINDAEKSDRFEKQLEDVWSQLEYREGSLGSAYPFVIDGDSISLLSNLNEEQRIYCFLLCCSRLRSFFNYKGLVQLWAKFFTFLCKQAFYELAPKFANIKIFDANSPDRKKYYGTDLRDALPILGRDLGVISVNDNNCKSSDPAGDGGFDLIAVLNFEDGQTSNFGILGQCGAQEKDWPTKNLEAHSLNLRHYFHTNFDHPSVMCTPVFYRDTDGSWVDERPTNGVVLLDRKRLLHMIIKGNHVSNIVNSTWFLQYEVKRSTIEIERD